MSQPTIFYDVNNSARHCPGGNLRSRRRRDSVHDEKTTARTRSDCGKRFTLGRARRRLDRDIFKHACREVFARVVWVITLQPTYVESLAILSASFSSSNGITAATGPKIFLPGQCGRYYSRHRKLLAGHSSLLANFSGRVAARSQLPSFLPIST